jgi:large subunit ribosomal protein L10
VICPQGHSSDHLKKKYKLMKKQDKADIVADLTQKFEKYNFVYITDSSSITANKTNELRRTLHKGGIKMQVAKNTLIRKAIENSGKDYGDLVNALKGSSSSLLFAEDMKAPAKIIKDFRKKSDKPVLKGAYIASDIYIGDNQLDALMVLKSKDDLIGEIIGLLQSPAKNVIGALMSGGNKLAGIVKTLSEKPE